MTQVTFQKIIKTQCDELERRIGNDEVGNAEEADEAAAELAGETNLDHDSEKFDALLSILFTRAGEVFPGAWDDYPKPEARFSLT